ncbi:MAG: hypothetical protein IIB58_03820 [Planctomycetes bacterium]|nr:hypothetical protein [Planctomycetota bacterium]
MAVGDRLLPALLERGRERRTEQKRKDRLATASNLLSIVQGKGSREEKQQAALAMNSLGFSVSNDLLRDNVDLSEIYDFLKVPEEIRDNLDQLVETGHSTPGQVLQFGAKFGGRAGEMSLDRIRKLSEHDFFKVGRFKGSRYSKMTPEQIFAETDFFATLKKELGVEGMQAFLGGKQAKPTATEEKIALVQKYTTYEDGSQVPIELLLPDEERMLGLAAGGMNRAAVMASYNVDTKAIESAERSIKSEVMASSVLLLMDLGGYLDAYAKGTEDAYIRDKNGEIQKHKQVAMNIVKENYNKSGEIRMALVKERADKSLQLAIENSASVGNLEAAGLPIRMQGYMQTIMEIEADSGERVTKSMVRKWMKEDSQLPGYNLTPEQEEQFLSYFEE